MQIHNLHQGLIVSNYREMCRLLDEKILAGNSKVTQLQRWSRYFSHEKIGNKFKILEIYNSPKSKLSNALYIKHIELLLLHDLSAKQDNTCNYTRSNLYHFLGMINDSYFTYNRDIQKNNITTIPYWQVEQFHLRCNKKLSEALNSALNSMKKRSLIDYSEQWIIRKGKDCYPADSEDIELIIKVNKLVRNKMSKCDKMLFLREQEFYDNVNAKVKELYDWNSVYREIKISSTKNNISVHNKTDFRANRLELNSKVLTAINNQAESLYKKNNKRLDETRKKLAEEGWLAEGEHMSNTLNFFGFTYPADYIDNQKRLAEIFLRISQDTREG